ncbi:MAG: B12-binding domain-containing radical SAM protein [Thermodesulfovibrionales bacterium]|nr:B12-binding domain-containing radical SAM protein [Thermodesulfovibrionales bacterium]
MTVNKISFIEAKSPGNHVFSKFPIPRLGAVLLSTLLKQKGYYVRVFIEDISEPDWFFIENSDVVCISTITSTALRAYQLAERFKKNGSIIILGGIHPTFLPEEAIEHADYVIRGEGEQSLLQLMDYIQKGSPSITSILGLTYKDKNGRIIHNPTSPYIEDLNSLPEPDFSLIHNWKASYFYPISTSRGCPFNCKFCSVIEMFGRKYRYKSVESTIKEIRNILNPKQKTKIFFVDDNFTANKERTKKILKGILSEKLNISWSAQTRVDIAKDDELLRLMVESGCDTLHIGFESINPRTLEAFDKKQTIDENIKCVKKLKEYSLKIHGMFILGADTDDVETIKRTLEFANNLRIDTVQFLMLTPLPGTIIYEEMENKKRIIHHNWSKYDAHHVTFVPERMKPETLHLETLKAMGKFYSWKYIMRHLLKFDLFYAVMGLYAKNAIKDALKEAQDYFKDFQIVSPYMTKGTK